jgi:poly(A) polymerase
MGYVAGVASALLTARICQLYPNAAASTVVTRLFKIYHQWQWPQPVYLKPIEDLPMQMKVWNPRIHVADRFHKMPVITPAYPSMCSTHNVTASTLRIMTEEFRRGAELMLKIEQKKALWADLFAKTDFFARHRNYFQILAVSESEDAHLIWSGFLSSKVRHLTPKLELEEYIDAAPPFCEGFELVVEAANLEQVRAAHYYVDDEDAPTSSIAPEPSVGGESKKYFTMAFYVALIISPPDPARKGPRRVCLDGPINDFKTFVSSYEKLTPAMHLLIRDIKRENLPAYIFDGQARPPKKGRRPKPAEESVGSPKRTRTGEISVDSSMSMSAGSLPTVESDATAAFCKN